VTQYEQILARSQQRYADGESRLPDDPDERQRQLTRLGNAANAAALCLLMLGRDDEAAEWFDRAATRWRESYEHAPPGSWGRPIGALKARVLAGDWTGAAEEAHWALELSAPAAESPIGRYAGALALLALDRWEDARPVANSLHGADGFPEDVADALRMIAAGDDAIGYIEAVEHVLASFETRTDYLEDVPVADTVLVLQALASRRDLVAELESELLPTR
jgi:tetratricopeptide (TPR) repeat protein